MSERLELMIRKEGSQWCLFTKDGTRKLGCHDTEEGAKAQEVAVKSHEAMERGGGVCVQFSLSDIDIDDGDIETLPNGDVVKWIPLAEAGEEWVKGGRTFDITPDVINQGIANFEARGRAPLPITFGHLNNPGAPAAAWIEDIQLRADGRPWGKTRFLADTWASVRKGEYKFFSLEFWPIAADPKGNEIGFLFEGGALVNKPFFPNLRIDQVDASSDRCIRLSRFTSHNPSGERRTKEPSMSNDKDEKDDKGGGSKDAPRKTEDGSMVLTREQYDGLRKDQAEKQRLQAENDDLKAKADANETRLINLEKGRKADRLRSAISTLQKDHGVVLPAGDFNLSHDDDLFAWLATAPFGVSTVEGFEKLARDTELTAHLPRIPMGKERSSGTTDRTPVDLSTEAGVQDAVRRRVSQLRRDFTKDELDPMLARRHQTIAAFARQELAAENPEHRKVIEAAKL